MIIVSVGTTLTPVLPAQPIYQQGVKKRWVSLQNQSANTIYLQWDGAGAANGPLSSALGYQLAAGATLNLIPEGRGGSVGQQRIDAIATVANSALFVQTDIYVGE